MVYSSYGIIESLYWVKKYVFGPSLKPPQSLEKMNLETPFSFLRSEVLEFQKINQKMSILFLGDLMSLGGKGLKISKDFQAWASNTSHLVINLEALLTNKKAHFHLKQFNDFNVLDDLKLFFEPEKTILSLANNHALDFGPDELRLCVDRVRNLGFRIIGLEDSPSYLIDSRVRIVAATEWSNRKGYGIMNFKEKLNLPKFEDEIKMLFIHWGHEFELYPRPSEIRRARHMLDSWDAIIGHHSHCPQPVAILSDNQGKSKPVAFSLGNMAIAYRKKLLNRGLALKVNIGPPAGDSSPTAKWVIGSVSYQKTKVNCVGTESVELDLDYNQEWW